MAGRQTRPLASSLNYVAGQVVPNSVIAKVGTNGKVSINNANGSVNVVVDILGYLSPSSPGRHFPVTPARLLDTRPDNVAPIGPNSTRTITVTGVGGVPASGVSAVALNVVALSPTANTFITVWPNGETRPNTSSLNPRRRRWCPTRRSSRWARSGKVQLYNQQGTLDCAGGRGRLLHHIVAAPPAP